MTESELKKIKDKLSYLLKKEISLNSRITKKVGLIRIAENEVEKNRLTSEKERLETSLANTQTAISLCKEIIALNAAKEKLTTLNENDLEDVYQLTALFTSKCIKKEFPQYDGDISELIAINNANVEEVIGAIKIRVADENKALKDADASKTDGIINIVKEHLAKDAKNRRVSTINELTNDTDHSRRTINKLIEYDMKELKKYSPFSKAKETVKKKAEEIGKKAKKTAENKNTLKYLGYFVGGSFLTALVGLTAIYGCHGKNANKSSNVQPTEVPQKTEQATILPTAEPTNYYVATDAPTATPTATPTAEPTVEPTVEPTATPAPTLSPVEITLQRLENDLRSEYYDEETIESTLNRVFNAYVLYKEAGYDISIEEVAYVAKVALVDLRTDEKAMQSFASSGYAADLIAHNGTNPEKFYYLAEARALNVAKSETLKNYFDEISKLINQELTGSITSEEYDIAVQDIVSAMMDDPKLTQADRAHAALWFNNMGIGSEDTFKKFKWLTTIGPDKCAEGVSLSKTKSA